jgi:superfamily I DNA/RNA helicase
LPLSISYRCAKNIVKEAKTVYDDIEEFDKNEDGIVRRGCVDEIREGDFVLCRNTRPLIDVFFKLIDQNKKAYVVGKDMEKGLLAMLSGFDSYDTTGDAMEKINELKEKLVLELKTKGISKPEKHPKYQILNEKVSILKLLFNKFTNIGEVEQFIEQVFNDEDREGVRLMTGHRSKGLERDRVFIIETFEGNKLVPSSFAVTKDQKIQESNLQFVMITRAKRELVYLYL